MSGKIIIEPVYNGFIVTDSLHPEEQNRMVFSFHEGIKESVVNMLNNIKEVLGFGGSKHDEKRIFIRLENQHDS